MDLPSERDYSVISASGEINHPGVDKTPRPTPSRTALAGRRVQWSQLWSEYLRAKDGAGQVVMLNGEPGIGKSRLLNELAGHAEEAGAVVLRGGASNGEGLPAYLPFLTALGESFRRVSDAELQQMVGLGASMLVNLFPDLAARLQQRTVSHTPRDQARFRLHEAIGDYLAALATQSPVVMILDDLQWADAESLDLIHSLAARRQTAVTIIGSYRSDELQASSALDRLLIDLNRARRLTVIPVPALNIAEVADLVLYRIGAPLRAQDLAILQEWSDGNPFFAEELLRAWVEEGSLIPTDDQWILLPERANVLPEGITGAIRRRLAAIDSATLDILRVAAVCGRAFSTDVPAAAAAADLETVEGQLEGASRRSLVSLDGRGGGAFTHHLVREYLYRELTPAARRRLHAAIGAALEARVRVEPEAALADLVSHFRLGEGGPRGAHYARLAAERALRSFAPADAVRFLDDALAMSEVDDPGRGDLLLSKAEAVVLAGKQEKIEAAYAAARAWFSSARDPRGVERVDRLRARAMGEGPAVSSARRELEEVFDALGGETGSSALAVGRRYLWRAWRAVLEGAWEDAEQTLRVDGLSVVQFGDEPMSTLIRLPRGFAAFQRGHYAEASDEWEQAAASTEFPIEVLAPLQWSLYGLLSLCSSKRGRADEARRYLDMLLSSSPGRSATLPLTRSALTLGALSSIGTDESTELADFYSRLLEMRGEIHWVLVDRVLGLIDLARRDWSAAHTHLTSAETTARDEGLRPELAATLLARAKLEIARGGRGSALRGHGLLQDARVLFAELDMAGALDDAGTGLGALGAMHEPHGLSAREVSVLRLVAAGHGNRRIAVALSLSEKTVANHLTNIFNKIGVSNRAGAAGFAHREGIV